MLNLAPVVVFVYNRSDHIKKTIEFLKNNQLALETDIIIYSDGADDPENKKKVLDVRNYLHQIKGFKSVKIVERDHNFGLGKNIIDGVTNVINKYGKVIVLEDDILTSPFFLKFMNEALDKYQYNKSVMQISGYTYPFKKKGVPDVFFMSWPDCWGWATWKRTWDLFERNPQKLLRSCKKKDIKYINVMGSSPSMWEQVISNANGEKYTWAIFFHIMVCVRHGLTLYCRDSLTYNIGFDGSGDNCGQSTDFETQLRETPVEIYDIDIIPNKKAENNFIKYNKKVFKKSCFIGKVLAKISEIRKK